MTEILGREAVVRQERPTLDDLCKQCYMCLEEIAGSYDY